MDKKLDKPLPEGTHTVVAISRHPIHPMLVTFPIALLLCAVGSDVAYLFLNDPFWARVSLWLLGVGTLMGTLAGLAGTVELLAIAGIRNRAAAWSHFVMAIMLLAVAFINWLSRLADPAAAIFPIGIYLSLLGALLVGLAGWMGGKLVFEDNIATEDAA